MTMISISSYLQNNIDCNLRKIIYTNENLWHFRSNITKCCRVPIKLRNKRIIPSQRVRIFPWSEVYIPSVWGACVSLSNSARRWCCIFRDSRIKIPNLGWISSSSFHACRWINYSTFIPSSKETQASIVCIKSWWDSILYDLQCTY